MKSTFKGSLGPFGFSGAADADGNTLAVVTGDEPCSVGVGAFLPHAGSELARTQERIHHWARRVTRAQ